MPIRFDFGDVVNHEITPEGFLRCKATYARDGILEYRRADGTIRREFRPPEVNAAQSILKGYNSKAITIEHPSQLVDADNASNLTVGITDPSTIYESPYVTGWVTIFDSKAIELARKGEKIELSTGYLCDIEETPGEWNGVRYDAKQLNIRPNHIALTSVGRAGREVKLHLDSADDDIAFLVTDNPINITINSNSNMSTQSLTETINIRIDAIDVPIPLSLAPIINNKIQENETLKVRIDSQETQITQLLDKIEEITSERDRETGRADALEIQLEESRFDSEIREDKECAKCGGKKKHEDKWDDEEEDDDEEDDDDDEEEDDNEEEDFPSKKSKKTMKKDSLDLDAEVGARIDAWKKVDLLIPGISSSEDYNSNLDASQIKLLALTKLDNDMDYSNKSASYIEGRFDSVYQQAESSGARADSFHVNNLSSVVNASHRSNSTPKDAYSTYTERINQAWQLPLALTRSEGMHK